MLNKIVGFIKKHQVLLISILGISSVFYMYFDSDIKTQIAYKNAKYTIAVVTSDYHFKSTLGSGYDYNYSVSGKTYHKRSRLVPRESSKLLILYDSLNPSGHIVLAMYSINDTITAPKKGWKYEQVPIPIDSTEIRRYIGKWR